MVEFNFQSCCQVIRMFGFIISMLSKNSVLSSKNLSNVISMISIPFLKYSGSISEFNSSIDLIDKSIEFNLSSKSFASERYSITFSIFSPHRLRESIFLKGSIIELSLDLSDSFPINLG